MRVLSVMACLVLFSGCSVQSSQLSAVMGLFKTPGKDTFLNGWSVKYANYEAMVYPVALPQGILFSNKAGDQVFFDGWSITQVSGMGRGRIALSITDTQSERQYRQGNRLVAVHQCQEWQRQVNSGMTSFSQLCSDKKGLKFSNSYENSILVVGDGSISIIRQIVDERLTPLTLIKLE